YNGYFKTAYLFPNIIKDIFFDGTIYHLWYLPASAIGAALSWYAVKRLGFYRALTVAFVLYVFGLLGDSYYGIVEKAPILQDIYAAFFDVSDYTRNGIFFAPVFFVLGGIAAEGRTKLSLKVCCLGFLFFFALMFVEGMGVHTLSWQRHDSMYLFLLPCVYFGFLSLTFFRGKRKRLLRTSTLILYLFHPMVIVVIRMFAKITGTQALFIENNMIHFLTVSVATGIFSVIFSATFIRLKEYKDLRTSACPVKDRAGKRRAWIEIDEKNLIHNVRELKKAIPKGCELMAVVKADAYGHGAFRTAVCLEKNGVKAFAVATIEEGIALRAFGIRGEILILGYTHPERAKELYKHKLMQTLTDYEYACALNRQKYAVKAHIKIDTGMHRLGFDYRDAERISAAFSMKYINVCGIYTHFCDSDNLSYEASGFTDSQISNFYKSLKELKRQGIPIPKTHMQSSYGLMNYPELSCDYVRAGIALYGVYSTFESDTRQQLDLRPVLSLRARIVLLRTIKSGESAGYGRDFTADRDSTIAIVSIGYADGLPRNLSDGKGEMIVRGCPAPVIGRICMDQCMIDVTEIYSAAVGDIVTLIGKDGGERIAAEEMAEAAGTITNELFSRLGERRCDKFYTEEIIKK
ncbi:MAG: serine racemase VanT catalytic subunit, partial [Lachnospiraceae bacterium]|nr:serine racemase VanT catalytic subunit [Lachnospiraceae bacterium]